MASMNQEELFKENSILAIDFTARQDTVEICRKQRTIAVK